MQKWYPKMLEELADIEHQQWIEWMNYFHSKARICFGKEEVVMIFKSEDFHRWQRQMETPYKSLRGGEKESDRKFARKVLGLMTQKED